MTGRQKATLEAMRKIDELLASLPPLEDDEETTEEWNVACITSDGRIILAEPGVLPPDWDWRPE